MAINHQNNDNNIYEKLETSLSMEDSEQKQDKTGTLSNSSIYERGEIPESHRILADSYMILKKIYGKPVVASRLTKGEEDFLKKYNFPPLEMCSAKQIEDELFLLRKWKLEGAKVVQDISDNIMNIRNKELKTIMARSYIKVTCGDNLGYKVFESYLENISKYS